MITKYIYFLFLLSGVLSACQPGRVFEQNKAVPVQGWSYTDPLTFEVHIPDTTAAYHLFIQVRHTDAYAYSNLWLILETYLPDSSVFTEKVQLVLAEPDGRWTGNCIDGICFNSILIKNLVRFPQAGLYRFKLEQDMRENPLPSILDIGLRIERSEPRQTAPL